MQLVQLRHARSWAVIFVVMALCLVVGVKVANAAEAPKAQYSKEQILRGVLFGQGAVAQDLGRVVDSAPASERGKQEQFQNQMLRVLRADYGGETDAAVSGLQSGDPFQVESSLRSLGTLANQAATKVSITREKQNEPVVTPFCGVIAVCGAVSVAAVALGAAVVVVVAGAVFNVKYTWFVAPDGSSMLDSEAYVADVTSALSR